MATPGGSPTPQVRGGAVDYFLKIDGGPQGESQDSKHKGEIDILSWSFGASQGSGHSIGSGGSGVGKSHMETFDFITAVNKGTAKIFQACASGEHFKTATLTCRKAGKDQQEYLKVTLTQVLVTSDKIRHSHDHGFPVEEVSLSFGKVEVEYKEQKPDGSLGGVTKGGWDLTQGKVT